MKPDFERHATYFDKYYILNIGMCINNKANKAITCGTNGTVLFTKYIILRKLLLGENALLYTSSHFIYLFICMYICMNVLSMGVLPEIKAYLPCHYSM